MKHLIPVPLFAVLAACVTINVYFPAAAAEKAADQIIDGVWGPQPGGTKPEPPAHPELQPLPVSSAGMLMLAALDFIIPPAAAAEPDISVSSPEIQRLTASMEARHASLLPHYNSGAIGLTADGLVTAREPNLIALADRNKVRGLVADENADRKALYSQIAISNGQPSWEAEIRKVFAARWVAKASAGWWYQDAGGAWKQK